jgi:hypothetical protein
MNSLCEAKSAECQRHGVYARDLQEVKRDPMKGALNRAFDDKAR